MDKPVSLAYDRIHTADAHRALAYHVAVFHGGALVRDRHIHACPRFIREECVQLVRRTFKEPVFVISQLRMYLRGVAVPQLFSQKSAYHCFTSTVVFPAKQRILIRPASREYGTVYRFKAI